jgi:predicted site-specific integrase-resolvase
VTDGIRWQTALYARVSSEAQEKQQTIDSQVAELRAYAEAEVVREVFRLVGEEG